MACACAREIVYIFGKPIQLRTSHLTVDETLMPGAKVDTKSSFRASMPWHSRAPHFHSQGCVCKAVVFSLKYRNVAQDCADQEASVEMSIADDFIALPTFSESR